MMLLFYKLRQSGQKCGHLRLLPKTRLGTPDIIGKSSLKIGGREHLEFILFHIRAYQVGQFLNAPGHRIRIERAFQQPFQMLVISLQVRRVGQEPLNQRPLCDGRSGRFVDEQVNQSLTIDATVEIAKCLVQVPRYDGELAIDFV